MRKNPDLVNMQIKFKNKDEEYQFLKKIVSELGISIYMNEMDREGNVNLLWANDISFVISGYSIEEREKLGQEYFKMNYHPDDFKKILQISEEVMNTKKPGASVVYRIKSDTDDWKWIYSKANIIETDPEAGSVKAICIGFDITDKIAENQDELDILLKENAQLRNEIVLSKLTKTEKQIITELATGKSTKEIAEEQNRSYETINNHKRNIFKKLNIHKLSDLVNFAKDTGLV